MTDTAKRGRPSTIGDSKQIAAVLKTIGTDRAPSRFIAKQLEERGLVQFQAVKTGGRGRPRHDLVITGKGRSLLALAARW